VTTGRLLLVGTPIGNLEDMSPRAVRALSEASAIFCEDTRRTRQLLSALQIPAPSLVRLDQHTEASLAPRVAERVAAGEVVAVVTDAGMPTISDPGRRVVQEVAGRGLDVQVVPGPSAVSTALALSGMEAARYRFAGFLPRKGRDRAVAVAELAAEPDTVVIYEAPQRVARTVADLAAGCGPDRPVALARELTKRHEEVWRGTLGQAVGWLAASAEPPRGEWVLVVGPATPAAAGEPADEEILAALGSQPDRAAIARVAADLGVAKRRVYALAVASKKGDGHRATMP
jgi:16S rRNA (cytidine1402-2'-O)-methyltransferase